jgi:hypothetical protein
MNIEVNAKVTLSGVELSVLRKLLGNMSVIDHRKVWMSESDIKELHKIYNCLDEVFEGFSAPGEED